MKPVSKKIVYLKVEVFSPAREDCTLLYGKEVFFNNFTGCFVHNAEVQNYFESHCRKPCASPTIGRYEKDEQAAEDSND
jgi:hypothetical protein